MARTTKKKGGSKPKNPALYARVKAAAKKKLAQRMESGDCEFVIADHDNVHILTPSMEDLYDDPLA